MTIWMFSLGVLHTAFYPKLPSLIVFSGFTILFLLLSRKFPKSCRAASAFCIGAVIGTWQLGHLIAQQLPIELDHQQFLVKFEVASLVEHYPRSQTFIARVLHIECSRPGCQQMVGRKVRLSWFNKEIGVTAGDIWSAEVKLKRPRGFVNPGGFDYQAWLLSQNLAATGYVKEQATIIGKVQNWASVRAYIQQRLFQASQVSGFQRFWLALALADRTQITNQDWVVLQKTGTIHLMAISGLHIGLAAVCMHLIGGVIARLVSVLTSRHQSGALLYLWLPAIMSIFGAGLYAALAGFSIPTTRALIACLAIQAMRLLGWRVPSVQLLAIALCAVALSDPLAVTSAGFWLSFGAVLSLIILVNFDQSSRRGLVNKLGVWIKIQLVLALCLTVPLIALGQQISLVSPLANLIAIPIVSFVIVPMLLVAVVLAILSPWMGTYLLSFLDQVFEGLWWYLTYLAEDTTVSSWWPTPVLSVFALGLAIVGLLLALSPKSLRLRWLGYGLLVAVFLIPRKPAERIQLAVLDVGQGLAMVLQVDGQSLIYDTGPKFSDQFDAGSRIVLPYLRSKGIRQPTLIVSHDDLDHSGGAPSILAALNLSEVYLGEPLQSAPDTQSTVCYAGQSWQMGRAQIEVLWPPIAHDLESNNASCVVLVSFKIQDQKDTSLLFAGDISDEVEDQLLPRLPANIDVVIASHHGSLTSSSFRFVRKTSPDYVVYSAGYRNRYNHPHPRVRRRFARESTRQLNTAESGAVLFTWQDGEMQLKETRKVARRAWYW